MKIQTITFTLVITLRHSEGKPQFDSDRPQCSDYADFGFFCVPFFQCDDDSHIITDGTTLLDPRDTDNADCDQAPDMKVAITSKCRKLTERCCLHPKLKDTCNFKPGPGDPNGPNIRPPSQNCAKRNPNGVSTPITPLKLERDDTKFGEWPHVCAILTQKLFEGKELKIYKCGASLIEPGVVLTAAHCLADIPVVDILVRCGEWDTVADDPLPYQERSVTIIQVHPCYNSNNLHNDLALLFVVEKFNEEPHIKPACIPQPDTTWPRQECVSNGWGKDKFGAEGKFATVLKKVNLPLVDSQQCQEKLRKNTRLGPFFELHKSFLCAGGEDDRDTCKGDGGSPLTCELNDGSLVQAGIVSWGIGCGEIGTPAVYTDVGKAACWIDTTVRCFYGGLNVESPFGFLISQCPEIRCRDLGDWQCE